MWKKLTKYCRMLNCSDNWIDVHRAFMLKTYLNWSFFTVIWKVTHSNILHRSMPIFTYSTEEVRLTCNRSVRPISRVILLAIPRESFSEVQTQNFRDSPVIFSESPDRLIYNMKSFSVAIFIQKRGSKYSLNSFARIVYLGRKVRKLTLGKTRGFSTTSLIWCRSQEITQSRKAISTIINNLWPD